MGYVFKARQPRLDRFVALKILPQTLAADPAFAERFAREGRVLARLNHPNIVTIHDFGQAGGFFYLLIEFVDGVNLRQAMQSGRIQPAEALGIVPKVCDALQFAHNEGILHRDIKPENIMLDAKGRVKIADFGIAKLMGNTASQGPLSRFQEDSETGEGREGDFQRGPAITETGRILGTPHYMAPEQIETPSKVDHRADIYSLGVVFYEMLTGELPLGRFAPPSQKSTADPRLDEVVCRTLEKEPQRRTQSAGEVKTQVETIATTRAGTPQPETLAAGRSPPGGRINHPARSPSTLSRLRPFYFPFAGAVLLFACASLVFIRTSRSTGIIPPPGLIGWYRAEGDALDSFGTNDGHLVGGVAFSQGEAGRAFDLNGSNQFVEVFDSADLNPEHGITIEAWIYPRKFSGSQPIVKKAGEGLSPDHGYELELAGSNGVFFGVYLGGGVGWVVTGYAPVPLKKWSHVAGVYNGTNVAIFVNGAQIGTASVGNPGRMVPSANHLQIGHDPANNSLFFDGLIDEMSLYSSALTDQEVRLIFEAGRSGKNPSPPIIVNHPVSRAVFAGQSVRFAAGVAGAKPISYQWLLNGTPVSAQSNPTATNAVLVLSNIQSSQSGGLYSVSIRNPLGTTNSLNAALTVNPTPPGLVSWWAAENNAADSYGTNDGQIKGAVSFSPGMVGQAFDFGGLTGTIVVPDSPGLRISNQLSVEAWVYVRSTNGDQGIVSKLSATNVSQRSMPPTRGNGRKQVVTELLRDGTGSLESARAQTFEPQEGYQLGITGSRLVGAINSPGQPWPSVVVLSGVAVPVKVWCHVAWTYDQSVMKLYLNGQPIVSNVVGSHPIGASHADLRISGADNHVNFDGLMDEVSIYNRALSDREVQAIFEAGNQGKPQSPPTIVGQPATQNLFAGEDALFHVDARGSQPLRYQWRLNGADLPAANNATATNATLVLTGMPTNGTKFLYSVVVSNALGAVESAGALLTVNPQPPCCPVPEGLVGWWTGDGNALDSVGDNHGTIVGGLTYVPGKVGKAFKINGDAFSQSYVTVPDSTTLNPTSALSVEAWIYPTGPFDPVASPIVKKAGTGIFDPTGYSLEFTSFGTISFSAYLNAGLGWVGTPYNAPETALVLNHWNHVVGTYDGDTLRLYIDGHPVSSRTAPGSIVPSHNPLQIGHDPASVPTPFFNGLIDEVSIYNRALSEREIRAIFAAGSAGKCPSPPAISQQPLNQNAFPGQTIRFTVSANGTPPLHYQWRLNGIDIPSTANLTATNGTLVLRDVQSNDTERVYSAVISNAAGTVTSARATLTVIAPRASSATPGLVSWWRAEGNASDSAGANDGTLMNGTGFGPGMVGRAFSFNGINQWVDVPNKSDFNPTGSFSIDAWIYVTGDDTKNYDIFAKWAGLGVDYRSYGFGVNRGYTLGFAISDAAHQIDTPFQSFYTTNNAIAPETWTHVAAVYDQLTGTRSMFVNGAKVASRTDPPITVLYTPLDPVIGAQFDNSSALQGFFNGKIDELAFYNRALSENEIWNIYRRGANGRAPALDASAEASSGLISWWRAEGNANDAAGTNDGVMKNGASFAPGKVGRAFSFNGNGQYLEVPSSPSLNPTGSLTLEAWVYPRRPGGIIMGKWSDLEDYLDTRSYDIALTQNNGFQFGISDAAHQWDSEMHRFNSPDGLVPLETWTHVAAVYDQPTGTRIMYVNGERVASRVDPPINILRVDTKLSIGARMTTSVRAIDFFSGLIDEPSLYNRALSAAEIRAIYNAGSAGKQPGAPASANH